MPVDSLSWQPRRRSHDSRMSRNQSTGGLLLCLDLKKTMDLEINSRLLPLLLLLLASARTALDYGQVGQVSRPIEGIE